MTPTDTHRNIAREKKDVENARRINKTLHLDAGQLQLTLRMSQGCPLEPIPFFGYPC